ncbi:unnamed protein product [Protopolystoma xenopodis]|uniref:Uncharacterized protein n=1 Tax=Protopolystoma xenopodis TaxID=117903 RepID=A0A448WK29_9PLAT|nr:unnamed protein product [Protopolystoma xenopodis]
MEDKETLSARLTEQLREADGLVHRLTENTEDLASRLRNKQEEIARINGHIDAMQRDKNQIQVRGSGHHGLGMRVGEINKEERRERERIGEECEE